MEKKRIYPENTPPGNIPYNVVNPAFRYRAIVPADDSIVMEVDANGVLYVAAAYNTLTVATPVATVIGRSATVTCATPGATIFYTKDGSFPSVATSLYMGSLDPVPGPPTTYFRVVAVKNGMVNSEEISVAVNYLDPPVISFDGSLVTLINPNGEGNMFFTTDGSTPTDQSKNYSSPFPVGVGEKVKAIVDNGTGSSPVSVLEIVKE